MEIIFVGTVEFSKRTLIKLLDLNASIVGVVTQEPTGFNTDYADLRPICRDKNIPCLSVKTINAPDVISWMTSLKPDIVFCFGLSQLLSRDLLNLAPMGVVGYHPALLPRNRGRHPIVWALALGMTMTGSTFFFMDEGADSGPILSQRIVSIAYEDTAQSLYNKITEMALEQIEEFLPQLVSGQYPRVLQDETAATVWRKRGHADGKIDFRMSRRAIYNLVRALTKPYVGAHVDWKGKQAKVWNVRESGDVAEDIEYGKVLGVERNSIRVKCMDGAVTLVEHELVQIPKPGEYLL